MDTFPPNRKTSKPPEREPVQRVTSSDAVRRRRPLSKQFKETFFGGDAHTAWRYMISNVMIPAIQDTIIEMVQSGIERVVRGDRTRRTGSPSGLGHVNYRGYGAARRPSSPPWREDDRPPMPSGLSRAARARHGFDEIIIPSRQEAEEVLDRLFEIISKYESVTVADLYEMTGLTSSHTDHTWGWTDLRGASVGRVRGGGYLLSLPDPEFLS
jgi:hypothetical protein